MIRPFPLLDGYRAIAAFMVLTTHVAFNTGEIRTPDDLAPDDFRRTNPRFQGENFQKNIDIVDRVKEVARDRGCTPGQLALAWLLAQGDDLVPIPGTRRVPRLEENVAAAEVALTPDDLAAIERAASQITVHGARYSEGAQRLIDR